MRVVPETSNRADWPRLVAQSVNDSQRRLDALGAVVSMAFAIDGGSATSTGTATTAVDGGSA